MRSHHYHAVGIGPDAPAAVARITEASGHTFTSWFECAPLWTLGHNLAVAGAIAAPNARLEERVRKLEARVRMLDDRTIGLARCR